MSTETAINIILISGPVFNICLIACGLRKDKWGIRGILTVITISILFNWLLIPFMLIAGNSENIGEYHKDEHPY